MGKNSKKKRNKVTQPPKNYALAEKRANELRQALMDNGISCEELWDYAPDGEKIEQICFSVGLYDIEGNAITFGFDTSTGSICPDV